MIQNLKTDVALYQEALATSPGLSGFWDSFRPAARPVDAFARSGKFGAALARSAPAPAQFGRAVMRRRRAPAASRGSLSRGAFRMSRMVRGGLHGIDGVWDTITDALGTAGNVKNELVAKGEKLELALKIIMGLSGVAAVTGTLNLLRR